MNDFKQKDAKKALESGYENAENILEDEDKMEKFLQDLEEKLKTFPAVGEALSAIPVMISLIKSYIKKEYSDIPTGTVVAVISALVYWLSPVDLVPDIIPGAGYIDDAAVVAFCLTSVGKDVEKYRKWREDNNKIINN